MAECENFGFYRVAADYRGAIVPTEFGELGITQYNAILADFIERIVRPVASRFDYQIDATEAHQNLEDWTSADAARKLRVFSTAANKSTGASHPMDQRRWFDFIIAVRSLLPLSSNATVDLH